MRQAALHYQRALILSSDDEEARINLGRLLMGSGRVVEAMALFEWQVASAPENVVGYAHLAGALVVAGYPGEAIEAARAALVREPYAIDPQLVLVRSDLMAARYDVARARLERLVEEHPECAQCQVQLGLIDQILGQPGRAEERYRAAQASSRPFPPASLRLAQVYVVTGRAAESAALLRDVEATARSLIDAGSESSWLRWQLAAAASVRGDRSAAVLWYREAVIAGRRDVTWDRWDPVLTLLRSSPELVANQRLLSAEHEAAAPVVSRLRTTLALQ